MTTIVLYRCDTCFKDHFTPEAAKACEARGRKDPLPVGLTWVLEDGTIAKALQVCLQLGHGLSCQSWVAAKKHGDITMADGWVTEDAHFEACPVYHRGWEDSGCFEELVVHMLSKGITPVCFNAARRIVPVEILATPGFNLRTRLKTKRMEVSCR